MLRAGSRRVHLSPAWPAVAVVAASWRAWRQRAATSRAPPSALTGALRAREAALLARAQADQARVASRWQGSLFERRTARIVEAARVWRRARGPVSISKGSANWPTGRRAGCRRGSRVAGGADVTDRVVRAIAVGGVSPAGERDARRRAAGIGVATIPRAARARRRHARTGEPSGSCLRDGGATADPVARMAGAVSGGRCRPALRWSSARGAARRPGRPCRRAVRARAGRVTTGDQRRAGARPPMGAGHRRAVASSGGRPAWRRAGGSSTSISTSARATRRRWPGCRGWPGRRHLSPANRHVSAADGWTAPTHTAGASAVRCATASAKRSGRSPRPSRRRPAAGRPARVLRRRAHRGLSHAVSAVRRSATAGADVAPRLSSRLQHRGASHPACGVTAAAGHMGSASGHRAARARGRRGRRPAGHAVQRSAVRARTRAAA